MPLVVGTAVVDDSERNEPLPVLTFKRFLPLLLPLMLRLLLLLLLLLLLQLLLVW